MAWKVQRGPRSLKGALYIVSTPIGNLDDITLRALRVLKEVDLIAAEDTRYTSILLGKYGISKPLVSYWGERERSRSEEIIKRLLEGQSVALVSDSGTPGISDPGAVLIRKALDEGISVVPVVGPSALIAAISVSGLPTEEFTFVGFLPSKKEQRRKKLTELALESRTIVFYESPHRIVETLADMQEIFGSRKSALVREITKIYEENIRGTIEEVASIIKGRDVLGEIVLVVEGRPPEKVSIETALLEVSALLKKGLGRKEAVKTVSDAYGLNKRELYERSLNK